MKSFANAREAKEFLVSRIVAEAERENVPLSEIERKMLYFSETGWTLPDMTKVNDEFDREYGQSKYEMKITHLIRGGTKRLRKQNPEEFKLWISAARKLKKEDHYISVMLEAAHVPSGSVSDNWKGGLLAVIFIAALAAFDILIRRLGLWMPRTYDLPQSYTINETLSNVVGYFVGACLILYCGGLIYAHFDSKRRLYKLADRALEPIFAGIFRLFGFREK
ncbi:MAG TPA: hypothetical protein VG322_04620 [Candidatus Acidoferrales bacterium]|jgi:hypothetical protein|nr:hypothetical protein [Candidatus Acidoferrales bacterium]